MVDQFLPATMPPSLSRRPLEVGVTGVENHAVVVDDRGCEVYRVRAPTGTVRVGGVSRRVGVGQRVHLGVDENGSAGWVTPDPGAGR